MLTQFDKELYPNDCEVVEMPLHNQFVYLVHKNGNSSLRDEATDNGYRIYKNQEIASLEFVDFYVRDPMQRYVSGINTYIQHLQRDHINLDRNTCIWFATRYNFLNRHYLPQVLWLFNLFRFTDPSCKIRFKKFEDIANLTKHNNRAGVIPCNSSDKQLIESLISPDVELWLFLDQLLENLAESELTKDQILDHLSAHSHDCYQLFSERFIEIGNKIFNLS